MILKTRHTGLVVRNLKASIHFYESLGFTIWKKDSESGTYIDTVVGIQNVRIEWVKLKCHDESILELIQYYSHPDLKPVIDYPSNKHGCSHIAFTVKDIEEICIKIVQLGGTIVNSPVIAPSGIVKVAYCHDIDGILLEMVEEIGN